MISIKSITLKFTDELRIAMKFCMLSLWKKSQMFPHGSLA